MKITLCVQVMWPNKIFWTQDCEKTIATRQKLKNTFERADEKHSKYLNFIHLCKWFAIRFSLSTTLNSSVSEAFLYREKTIGRHSADKTRQLF